MIDYENMVDYDYNNHIPPQPEKTYNYDKYKKYNNYNEGKYGTFKAPDNCHVIYTDGSWKMVPDKYNVGGWAFYDQTSEYSDSAAEAYTTNNKMELKAIIEALKYVKTQNIDESTPIEIRLDSDYCRLGVLKWMKGWKENDWCRTNQQTGFLETIKNLEYWREIDVLIASIPNKIYWSKIKSHSGEEGNEKVDLLARSAVDQLISEQFT